MSSTSGISHSQNHTRNNFETERRVGNESTDAARAEDAKNKETKAGTGVNTEDTFVNAGGDPNTVSGEGPGGTELRAHTAGPSLEVSGGAEASIDQEGVHLDLQVDVDATLAEAGAGATKTFTANVHGEQIDVTVDLSALGKVGADGSLNLSVDIGTNGVNVSASAEGFAGANASLTGSISVSHEGKEIASGDATLSGTLGVAGSASANLDISGSEVSFGAKAAASVGGGLGVEVNGTVNTGNAANLALDIGEAALRDGVDDVAQFTADFAGEVGGFVGDRAQDVANLAGDVGGFAVDKIGDAADALTFWD